MEFRKQLVEKDILDKFLSESTNTSPFQTGEWVGFLERTSGQNVKKYSCFSQKKLKAFMVVTIMKEPGIKCFFSKRGIVFGGPVLDKYITDDELGFFLQNACDDLKCKVIYLETRNFFDYSAYKNIFQKSGWKYEPYLNFQISLASIEKEILLAKIKYNRRREIDQSLSNGASYGLCENENEIIVIYDILSDLYRRKVKLPLPSVNYFLDLYRSNLVKVFYVKHHNQIIGGSFCPFLLDRAIYTYYYCGIRDYHKRIFPTHLAICAAMEFALDNNIPLFDFMGAGKPNIEYGVRKYKSEFGGTLVEHGRFVKIFNPFMFKLGKLGLKVLSKT